MCPKRGFGWGVHSNERTTTECSRHDPTEVFFTLKTPILFLKNICFFIYLKMGRDTKRTYFLNFILFAFQRESFIFLKKRTFPFSDFHDYTFDSAIMTS